MKKHQNYINIWKKHNVKQNNDKLDLINNQDQLKECLGANEIPMNPISTGHFYIRSLRSAPNQPKKALNRYHNLQTKPLISSSNKWNIMQPSESDLIENKKAVNDYYLNEM